MDSKRGSERGSGLGELPVSYSHSLSPLIQSSGAGQWGDGDGASEGYQTQITLEIR